jgi:glycosyltransferase involved in cell wall biosynthesis
LKYITIAICTRGRSNLALTIAKEISNKIKSNNLVPFFDILIIDNNDSPSISLMGEESFFKVIHCSNVGLSNARNFALLNSNSQYVWFIDDECMILDFVLKKMLENVKLNKFDFIGGPVSYILTTPINNFRFDFNEIIRDYSFRDKVKNISGGNYCVKKSVAVTFGGFKPELGMSGKKIRLGEESDLLARHEFVNPNWGTRRLYDPEIVLYSVVIEKKYTKTQRLKRAYASGKHSRYKIEQKNYLLKYGLLKPFQAQNIKKEINLLSNKKTLTLRTLKIYLKFKSHIKIFIRRVDYFMKISYRWLVNSNKLSYLFFLFGRIKK